MATIKEAASAFLANKRVSEFIGMTGGHFLLRHEQEIRAANAAFIAKHSNGSR